MTQRARRQSSFWEELGEYLIGEVKAAVKIFLYCLAFLFLTVSVLVGMYQVATSVVYWILF